MATGESGPKHPELRDIGTLSTTMPGAMQLQTTLQPRQQPQLRRNGLSRPRASTALEMPAEAAGLRTTTIDRLGARASMTTAMGQTQVKSAMAAVVVVWEGMEALLAFHSSLQTGGMAMTPKATVWESRQQGKAIYRVAAATWVWLEAPFISTSSGRTRQGPHTGRDARLSRVQVEAVNPRATATGRTTRTITMTTRMTTLKTTTRTTVTLRHRAFEQTPVALAWVAKTPWTGQRRRRSRHK